MKFITQRIISPSKVRSLQEIINDELKKDEASTTVRVASSQKKVTKTAQATTKQKVSDKIVASEEVVETAVDKAEEVKAEEVKAEEVTEAKTDKKHKAVEASTGKTIKEIKKSDKKQSSVKFKSLFTKISKLQDVDREFLRNYFGFYYPSDYVDALLSQY